jgi:hypothetical protein
MPKSKAVAIKQKSTDSFISKDKVLTIAELIANDTAARLAVAKDFAEKGEGNRVFFGPNNQVLSLRSSYDINQVEFAALAKKKPQTITYKVNQLLRFKSEEDDSFGKQQLIVQLTATVDDYNGNRVSFAYNPGHIQSPLWKTSTVAWDSKTGQPLQTSTQFNGFVENYTIPFSAELVKELAKNFYKVSLVLKTETGRKFTCEDLAQFTGEFEVASARLTPQVKRTDGSI